MLKLSKFLLAKLTIHLLAMQPFDFVFVPAAAPDANVTLGRLCRGPAPVDIEIVTVPVFR